MLREILAIPEPGPIQGKAPHDPGKCGQRNRPTRPWEVWAKKPPHTTLGSVGKENRPTRPWEVWAKKTAPHDPGSPSLRKFMLSSKCGPKGCIAPPQLESTKPAPCPRKASGYIARFASDFANDGGVAEWSKAHAWKVCRRGTVSRVRIPLPPPRRMSKSLILIKKRTPTQGSNFVRNADLRRKRGRGL